MFFKTKIKVFLRGENFPIKSEVGVENLGFFTHVIVSASSLEEAEGKAVNLIKNDSKLMQAIAKERCDELYQPKIFVEEFYECKWWKKCGVFGYTFFDMDKLNE